MNPLSNIAISYFLVSFDLPVILYLADRTVFLMANVTALLLLPFHYMKWNFFLPSRSKLTAILYPLVLRILCLCSWPSSSLKPSFIFRKTQHYTRSCWSSKSSWTHFLCFPHAQCNAFPCGYLVWEDSKTLKKNETKA